MKTTWFIEIQYVENNQIKSEYFKTVCVKCNTASNRAIDWCEKNGKMIHDILTARIASNLNQPLTSFQNLKLK